MIAIGATALALTLGGTAMAQGSSSSQGCTPIPPLVEPVMIPQPDGSEPVPPFVEPPAPTQPGTLRIVDGVACLS